MHAGCICHVIAEMRNHAGKWQLGFNYGKLYCIFRLDKWYWVAQ